MAGSTHIDEDEISGINITPLVDVVLVLLVIFMITAPALYKSAITVQLPKASTGEGAKTPGPTEIYVDRQGKIVIAGKTFSKPEFEKYLETSKPSAALILADTKAEHGFVIEVVDALRAHGMLILADTKAEHGFVIEVVDALRAHGIAKFSFGIEKKR